MDLQMSIATKFQSSTFTETSVTSTSKVCKEPMFIPLKKRRWWWWGRPGWLPAARSSYLLSWESVKWFKMCNEVFSRDKKRRHRTQLRHFGDRLWLCQNFIPLSTWRIAWETSLHSVAVEVSYFILIKPHGVDTHVVMIYHRTTFVNKVRQVVYKWYLELTALYRHRDTTWVPSLDRCLIPLRSPIWNLEN